MVKRPRNRQIKPSAIVYFDELLDEQHRQNIESMVERVDGVTGAHFNESQKQLMIVDYDPEWTNSGEILSSIRKQHAYAQLI